MAAWLLALSQGQLGKAMQAGSPLSAWALSSALFGSSRRSSIQDQSLADIAEAADDSGGEAAGPTEGYNRPRMEPKLPLKAKPVTCLVVEAADSEGAVQLQLGSAWRCLWCRSWSPHP